MSAEQDAIRFSYGNITPPEQQDYTDAAYRGLDKIAARPSKYTTSASVDRDRGSILLHPSSDQTPAPGSIVGSLSWDTTTGHVHNLDIEKGHRHMLPKLLSDAKAHADEQGYAPPLYSDNLSSYSYKLAKKHAPEYIPQDAKVNHRLINISPVDVHQMTGHINLLHASAIAAAEPRRHELINQQADSAHQALAGLQARVNRPPGDAGNDRNVSYYARVVAGNIHHLGQHLSENHPARVAAEAHAEKLTGR